MLADVRNEASIIVLLIFCQQLEERLAEPLLSQKQTLGDVQRLTGCREF